VSQAYAVDIGVMMSLLALFAWAAATADSSSLPERARRAFRREALNRWAAAGMFFLTVAPVFQDVQVMGETLRVWIWVLAVGVVWATRAGWVDPRP